MSVKEIEEMLEKQLQLLSEHSEKCATANELAELTAAMIAVSGVLAEL